MERTRGAAAGDEHFESWKEIAAYLHRDVRTLQRWEHTRDLPVHRLPGGEKAAVFATRRELDAWRRSRQIHLESESPAQGAPEASIAVLPFANLSGDPENDYFAEGLADEIITALTRIPRLQVSARTSSFGFRGRVADVREIAARLRVRTLLEGSVRRSGDRVRIAAQLIDAATGFHLWSERYDRQLGDIFAIQDDIAQAIRNSLRVRFPGAEPSPARSTANLDAYNLWLKGRYCCFRPSPENLQKARVHFEAALALDPRYALAHAGLAEYFLWAGFWAVLPPGDALRQCRAAAVRALDADPRHPEALSVMGAWRALHDFDWAAADRDFETALRLAPSSTSVRILYAEYCLEPTLRMQQAQDLLEEVIELDPLSPLSHSILGQLFFFRREYERAAAQVRTAIELDPEFPLARWILIGIRMFLGDTEGSLAAMAESARRLGPHSLAQCTFTAFMARYGDAGSARQMLDRLLEAGRHGIPVSSVGLSWIYFELGDPDTAFQLLERAIDERDPQIVNMPCKPLFDAVRLDPRFYRLLRRMKLPARISD